jgi:UDP-N-acetyl-D-mannosaminuronic acid dehydrogenase
MPHGFTHDVVVIGGGGHVGLPLAIALADRGAKTVIYDVSSAAVDTILSGELPFSEPGAQPLLSAALAAGMLTASTDPATVATARTVIVVIGTPVDEHLNPDPSAIPRALGACSAARSTRASRPSWSA